MERRPGAAGTARNPWKTIRPRWSAPEGRRDRPRFPGRADEERSLECTRKLVTLIENKGLPWFSTLSSEEALVKSSLSPLDGSDRTALLEDISNRRSVANWQLSQRLLGIADEQA